MHSNDDIDWPVHSLLSFHDLWGLPLRRLPSTVLCSCRCTKIFSGFTSFSLFVVEIISPAYRRPLPYNLWAFSCRWLLQHRVRFILSSFDCLRSSRRWYPPRSRCHRSRTGVRWDQRPLDRTRMSLWSKHLLCFLSLPRLNLSWRKTWEGLVQQQCTATVAADLMETDLTIRSSNMPINGSEKH